MASVEVGRQQSGAGAFPVGQRVTLLGHFPEPVVLEAALPIDAGYKAESYFDRALAVARKRQSPGNSASQ